MKKILTWLAILALLGTALSAELPLLKKGAGGPPGDLKTASSFIGPFGWGWGYPYWGYGKGLGWGWGGWGGWGYPYWG